MAPYMLFNCQHSFCKYCLITRLREVSDDVNSYPLKCPKKECTEFINIYDLKYLFDAEEFDRMCDKGVMKQISQSP